MRIAVIGAGITGLTTAFELAEDGHAVSVFDRCESVSAAASFATTGLVSPGCVSPAAAPGLSKWLLRGLYSHRTALRWRPRLSRQQWSWLLRWWRANRRTHPNDVRAMVELARVSTERLAWLTEVHRIDYERSRGVLMLLRRNDELQPAHRHAEMLRELGVQVEQITPERCRELEPGLRHTSRLAGALHLVDDSVGNCREFTHRLRDLCQQRHDVQFHFNVEISGFEAQGAGYRLQYAEGSRLRTARRHGLDPVLVTATLSEREDDTVPLPRADAAPPPEQPFDAVVLCTGAEGSPLLKPLGLRLPLLPVYGYSVSFRCRPEGLPPRSAVVDTSSGVAIARLGERVRVSGGFELGDFGAQHTEAALSPLYDALHHWFPFAAQRAQPQIWKGARPMLPEGPPVIGPARQPGLWLNLGHGAHGWTLACGAARLLADQIAGRSTQLDPDAYSLRRWT
jgi:D-amino-acid dehydrogenase